MELKDQGYLQSVPNDPGSGTGPSNYVAVGDHVFCLIHGTFESRDGSSQTDSPRDRLRMAGINDPTILAEASPNAPDEDSRPSNPVLDIELMLLPLLLLFWLRDIARSHRSFRLLGYGAAAFLVALCVAAIASGHPFTPTIALTGAGLTGLALLLAPAAFAVWQYRRRGLPGFGRRPTPSQAKLAAADGRLYGSLAWGALVLCLIVMAGFLAYGGESLRPSHHLAFFHLACTIAALLGMASAGGAFALMRRRLAVTAYRERLLHHVGGGLLLLVTFLWLATTGIMEASGRNGDAFRLLAWHFPWALYLLTRYVTCSALSRAFVSSAEPSGTPARSPGPSPSFDSGFGARHPSVRMTFALDQALCPVCASGFEPGADAVVCASCNSPHHRECWDFGGRCAIFACSTTRSRPVEDKRAQSE